MLRLNDTFTAKFNELGLTQEQQEMVGMHIMCIVSGAIGHRPFVDEDEKTYGNLNMIFVAPTGTGKGSSCAYAKEIFSGFGEDIISPFIESSRVTSMKSLLRAIHSELGNEIRRYIGEIRILHENQEFVQELDASISPKTGLAGCKCKIIDGRPIDETLGRQHICYPLLHYCSYAHITPEALKGTSRWVLVTNGYINRFICHEAPKGMTTPIPRLTQEIKTELADDIEASIRYATSQRAVKFSPEAKVAYDEFNVQMALEKQKGYPLFQYLEPRFSEHVRKLALIFAMIRRKQDIEKEEIDDATTIVKSSYRTIDLYLGSPSPQRIESEIITLVKSQGKIRHHDLCAILIHKFALNKIQKTIRELLDGGLLSLRNIDTGDGNFPSFYVVPE